MSYFFLGDWDASELPNHVRSAAITQWCHGCRGRPNKSQSQGLKHWIDINVLYTFIYMCGTGLPVPLQGTRGGTSQDMTWYVDLIGSFEMVNMRIWLLVTKDQNSKFPIDRSFSELLTSKLVLELPSHVASFSLCRRRRKPEVHGGFQVTGAESATRSGKRSLEGRADLSSRASASTARADHGRPGGVTESVRPCHGRSRRNQKWRQGNWQKLFCLFTYLSMYVCN